MGSPFDLAANKQLIGVRPHKATFLKEFKRQYGITDPRKYFSDYRRRILDKAEKDPFGVTKHETLDEWWDAKAEEWRYRQLASDYHEKT